MTTLMRSILERKKYGSLVIVLHPAETKRKHNSDLQALTVAVACDISQTDPPRSCDISMISKDLPTQKPVISK